MTYTEAQAKLKQYKCFFCEDPADRLGYFGKLYPFSGKATRENPTFFCPVCWIDPLKREQINCNRGGMEGVFCMTFEDLGKMTDKQVAIFLGRKNYEINHCANPTWRKMIRSIHYLSIPPKVK